METAFLLALILANGVFAMCEIAIVSSRKSRLQQLADEGDASAARALALAQEPTKLLATLQIGITSIAILTGIVGENALATPFAKWIISVAPVLEPYAHAFALALVVSVVTLISLVFGEIVPKRLGMMYAESIARLCAGPMNTLAWLATPLVKGLTFISDAILRILGAKESAAPPVTEEEIQVLMEQGADAGVFVEAEQQMIRNVFRLDDRQLTSLMVPRANIVYLDVEQSSEVNQKRIRDSHFSRFPVVRGDLSNVLGFARAKDLLAQVISGNGLDLQKDLQPALHVPETLTGTELIENFRQAHAQSAFVVDEYGEVQGLVTLKDLMEAIIGEVPTPQDSESSATRREDGSWLLDGLIALPDLKDSLELESLPDGDDAAYHTLSGMIMMQLGRIPKVADRTEWAGWRFEVVDMDGRRIDKVLASVLPKTASTDPDSHD